VLDILDEYPSCEPPFEVFLDMTPPLRPRYYSISSSPLVDAAICSITVGVLESPTLSGRGKFSGVCSNYLAAQPAESTVYAFVRKPTIAFHPPENPHLPMIMIGPGTGVAPFRGFLLERAALKKQGAPIGESLLFFGCRDPAQDFLYEDELRAFEAGGGDETRVRLLPRAGQAEDICAAGDSGERRRSVGALAERRASVCMRRGFAHGARRQAGFRRPFLQAHWRLCRGWQGVAHGPSHEPPVSGGHLGVCRAGWPALLRVASEGRAHGFATMRRIIGAKVGTALF
jgi:ferredoxin-NADP reductase